MKLMNITISKYCTYISSASDAFSDFNSKISKKGLTKKTDLSTAGRWPGKRGNILLRCQKKEESDGSVVFGVCHEGKQFITLLVKVFAPELTVKEWIGTIRMVNLLLTATQGIVIDAVIAEEQFNLLVTDFFE